MLMYCKHKVKNVRILNNMVCTLEGRSIKKKNKHEQDQLQLLHISQFYLILVPHHSFVTHKNISTAFLFMCIKIND